MSYYSMGAVKKLNVYEERIAVNSTPQKKPVRLKVVDRRRSEPQSLVTFKGLVTFIGIVICICFVLHNQVKINEVNKEISKIDKSITQLESEYVEIQSSLDTTLSLPNVIKQAEEELGMQRVGQDQVVNLRVYEEDKVEVVEKPKPEGFSENVEAVAISAVGFVRNIFDESE